MNQSDKDQDSFKNPQANKARWVGGLGLLLFAAFLAFFLGKGLNLDPNSRKPVMVGKKAYDFQSTWIQGQQEVSGTPSTLNLSAFAGKPVVVNFWASWCVSCRSEAAELERFWRKHKSDIVVIGVAVQDQKESALAFASQFGKTYPLGLDELGKAGIEYGVTGVPETFFVNEQGIITQKQVGPVTVSMMEKWLVNK